MYYLFTLATSHWPPVPWIYARIS